MNNLLNIKTPALGQAKALKADYSLSNHGLTNLGNVYWNLVTEAIMEEVIFRGEAVHVAWWARRFLFRSEQLQVAVGKLSGREQARILIATLMRQPADLLVLDEPTNDLDIPTLEGLEESLIGFPGAVVLVTHDRFLFERVTTTVLALDGTGAATAFADYRQWEASRRERPTAIT